MGYACIVARGDAVPVTLYTKPDCPHCMAARNDLVARGVEYQEIDVTVTPGARERLAELTFGTMIVPVIVEEDGEVHIATGGG
jgi:glutaredoxin